MQLSREDLKRAYERMFTIRAFEERVDKEFALGKCKGRPVRIRVPSGGEFKLYFEAGRRLEPEQEVQVRQVAQDLGEAWPQE